METLALIVLVVAILVTFSVLVGCVFSGQPLVVPRHAAAQRSINEGGFSRLRAHRVGSVSAAQEGQRGQHPEVDPTAVVPVSWDRPSLSKIAERCCSTLLILQSRCRAIPRLEGPSATRARTRF